MLLQLTGQSLAVVGARGPCGGKASGVQRLPCGWCLWRSAHLRVPAGGLRSDGEVRRPCSELPSASPALQGPRVCRRGRPSLAGLPGFLRGRSWPGGRRGLAAAVEWTVSTLGQGHVSGWPSHGVTRSSTAQMRPQSVRPRAVTAVVSGGCCVSRSVHADFSPPATGWHLLSFGAMSKENVLNYFNSVAAPPFPTTSLREARPCSSPWPGTARLSPRGRPGGAGEAGPLVRRLRKYSDFHSNLCLTA